MPVATVDASMQYRALPAAHQDAWRRHVEYAFTPEDGPDFAADEDRESPAEFARRALYADEAAGADGDRVAGAAADPEAVDVDLLVHPDEADDGSGGTTPAADAVRAVCGLYDFRLRVRGAYHRVGGVSAVASPPEWRRRGHVATMLEGVHRELRRDGVAFAALWPFEYEFYRRYGYAQIGQYAETTVPPAALAAVAAAPAGRFRTLDGDDWAAADAVYDAWATGPLAMDRTEDWWRLRVFDSYRGQPYAYGWVDEAGDLRAYLVYRIEGGEDDGTDDKRLRVLEAAAADRTARRHLYRFCRDHDSQVGQVVFRHRVADGRTLQASLEDPRAATVSVKPAHMLRATDVRTAVDAIDFPPAATGRVTLRIRDEACPWNDGRFALSVADGDGTLAPLDQAGASAPDLALGVGAFSQLLIGAVDAADLVERGLIEVDPGSRSSVDAARDPGGDPRSRTAAVETLAACLPAADPSPALREGF
jgi:predicted acetyltransferase